MELLRHAGRVPTLAVARTLNVAEIALARQEVEEAPSWLAVFLRAYGLLSRLHPELRRTLAPWPRQRLYEHPCSVCLLPIERDCQGEPVALPAPFREPENLSLDAIDRLIHHYREAPVWEIRPYRQMLRLGRLPGLLRRFHVWQLLHLSGSRRAERFGTFVLSSLGHQGVEQFHPLSPLTTHFTFGPVAANGELTAQMVYDPRVLDGRCAILFLTDLEQILHEDVLPELRALPAAASRSPGAAARRRTELKKPR
jgi:hypothetical protein